MIIAVCYYLETRNSHSIPFLVSHICFVFRYNQYIYTCDLPTTQQPTDVQTVSVTKDSCQNPPNAVPILGPKSSASLIPGPGSDLHSRSGSSSSSNSRFISNFTVCLGTLFGNYRNTKRLVEFIEFHRILGVDKFILYKNSVSPAFLKYMEFYSDQGVVDILPWQLPVKDLFYEGQHAMMNDCLYRNMHKAR